MTLPWGRKAEIERLRVEFSADAGEIEDRRLPASATALLWAVLGLIAAAVTWASLASIDRVVVANGKLITTASRIVLQPLETAAVRALAVRPGQVVAPGEVLVSLDPTFAAADERGAREQALSAAAEIRRLEAELAGAEDPGTLSEDPTEQRNQAETFSRRRAERTSMVHAYDAQIKEMQARIVKLRGEGEHALAQRQIIERLVAMRKELHDHGNGSLVSLLEAQNQLEADRRDSDRISQELIETEQGIAAAQARREANLREQDARAAGELQAARRELTKAQQALTKHAHINDLEEVRSPARAMVIEVAQRSVGSVVREGEPLVTLVPLDSPLEVDVVVDAKDIGHLRTGDSARIKLEALPYQKYGTLEGRVKSINADVIEEEVAGGRKAQVYKARIAITANTLHDVPPDFALLPGMAASGEVKVGKRRVISYFLYPIIRALDSGLREP